MDIPTHDELVSSIDAFLARTGMAETRLGRDAIGEASLIPSIREGRSPSLKTLNRLASFMAEYDTKARLEAEGVSAGNADKVSGSETIDEEWPVAAAGGA